MRNLVAVRPLVYANRRMQVGDYFTTRTHSDARVLVAIGKAREQRVPGSVTVPSAAVLAKAKRAANPLDHDGEGALNGSKAPEVDKDALNKLRADYTEVLGKKPFPGWDAAELQRRIDKALAS